MIDLSDRSEVVSGVSRGIGLAPSLRLARQGASFCSSYRGNAEAARATAAEIEALGRARIWRTGG